MNKRQKEQARRLVEYRFVWMDGYSKGLLQSAHQIEQMAQVLCGFDSPLAKKIREYSERFVQEQETKQKTKQFAGGIGKEKDKNGSKTNKKSR